MKKRILFLTTIYPKPNLKLLNSTSVCHYFTREWVEMGYDVKVIYNYTIFMRLLHFMAKFFESIIANRALSIVNTDRLVKDEAFINEGVKVTLLPIYKPLPRGKFSKKSIQKQIDRIVKSNDDDGFNPDIIIGHFHNPNFELVSLLKDKYKKKSVVVLHGDSENIKHIYKDTYHEMIDNIDFWGYRSAAIKESFENLYGVRDNSFMCYSGIPKDSISIKKIKSFKSNIKKFIYVGALIKRKYPVCVIKSLMEVYPDGNFSLSVIGKGSEKKKMEKIINKNNIQDKVVFFGHIPREEVSNEIEKAECLIMISEKETFGLVYLEAMAKGCITIGSKNEGIDGVISNNDNGFLCDAGSVNGLTKTIKQINSLSLIEKNKISANAIKTAKTLTDTKAAKLYLESINI